MTNVLGVIPARGGSKRIPRKNIQVVGGKPLVVRAIECAQASKLDRVIVSTEDFRIADICREAGAEVLMRPNELAGDEVFILRVLEHVLRFLEDAEGYVPDYVASLQPDSVLRTPDDIDAAIDIAYEKDATAVQSYVPLHQSPTTVDDEGRIVPPSGYFTRPNLLRPAGVVELFKTPIGPNGTVDLSRTYPYVVPESRHWDIDTPWQLEMARAMVAQVSGVRCRVSGVCALSETRDLTSETLLEPALA